MFRVLALIPLLLAAWIGWAVPQWYLSQAYISNTRVLLENHDLPDPAWVANVKAVATWDWDGQTRKQLMLTLGRLMAKSGLCTDSKRKCVAVSPGAADKAYRIAATAAPHAPALLITRAEYLINSNRWREPEMATLMARVQQIAAAQPEMWMAETLYANLLGDAARMTEAIRRGLALPNGQRFQRLVERLEQ